MRGTRFLHAVLELARANDVDELLDAAVELAARALRASRVWIEVPARCGLIKRVRGETAPVRMEATVRAHCHPGAIGVCRAEPFSELERERLELIAGQLALVLERIAIEHPGATMDDSVLELKHRLVARALERNDSNVAAVARELGVARSHVYDLVRSLRSCRSKCSR